MEKELSSILLETDAYVRDASLSSCLLSDSQTSASVWITRNKLDILQVTCYEFATSTCAETQSLVRKWPECDGIESSRSHCTNDVFIDAADDRSRW